jgi:uncharacterized protein (DUF1330 family)
MAAYVLVRVRVTDAEQYAKYKLLTPAAIEKHGGRFLVRGGNHETLEGAPDDRRMVVLEFETVEAAKAFYDSPEYRHARDVRDGAADMDMTVVEGV